VTRRPAPRWAPCRGWRRPRWRSLGGWSPGPGPAQRASTYWRCAPGARFARGSTRSCCPCAWPTRPCSCRASGRGCSWVVFGGFSWGWSFKLLCPDNCTDLYSFNHLCTELAPYLSGVSVSVGKGIRDSLHNARNHVHFPRRNCLTRPKSLYISGLIC